MCDRRTPHVIVREGGLFKYGETGIMSSVYTTLTIYTNHFWVRFVKYWQNIQFVIFPFILDVCKVLSIIKLPLKNKHKISKLLSLLPSKLRKEKFGPTASIFYGIWITQSGSVVFIFNLDKVLLKKLCPTMNG